LLAAVFVSGRQESVRVVNGKENGKMKEMSFSDDQNLRASLRRKTDWFFVFRMNIAGVWLAVLQDCSSSVRLISKSFFGQTLVS
jgi:hypothetical protein